MSTVPSNQTTAAPTTAFSTPAAAVNHTAAWMTILADILSVMGKAAPVVIPMLGNANTRSEVTTGVQLAEVAGEIVAAQGEGQ